MNKQSEQYIHGIIFIIANYGLLFYLASYFHPMLGIIPALGAVLTPAKLDFWNIEPVREYKKLPIIRFCSWVLRDKEILKKLDSTNVFLILFGGAFSLSFILSNLFFIDIISFITITLSSFLFSLFYAFFMTHYTYRV